MVEGSIGTERIWGRHLNLTGGMRHGILEKVTVLDEDVSVNTDERKPNLGHWGGACAHTGNEIIFVELE